MSKKRGFSCPVCDEVFSEEDLMLHVNEHFHGDQNECDQNDGKLIKCSTLGCGLFLHESDMTDHLLAHRIGEAVEDTITGECSKTEDYLIPSDSIVAMMLQNEEHDDSQKVHDRGTSQDYILAQNMQREEENKLESAEFQKLQEQYGMTSTGGYTQQFENRMQKKVGRELDVSEYFHKKAELHASLITGNDSNETRTTGLIQVLSNIYDCGISGVTSCHLCTETDHYSSDVSDRGWGCGYRNTQMLFSSMLKIAPYKDRLSKGMESGNVPSVPRLQSLIERAWREGYDVSGCEQLGGTLTDTTKWIGATEVAALLRWLGVRARIVDFHQAASNKTNPMLFEWIDNYFRSRQNGQTSPPFPLFLQHQGHSRLCIGIEEHSQGDFKKHLLLFDPSYRPRSMAALRNLKLPSNKTQTKDLRKSLYQMKQQQFQVVFVDGLYDNESEREEDKILRAIRISSGIL